MQLLQLRFDRVFDTQPTWGLFSFNAGRRNVYSVALASKVIPSAGDEYGFALGRADDWDTIVAWRDLAQSQVAVTITVWQAILRGLLLFWHVGATLPAIGHALAGPLVGVLVLGAELAAASAYLIRLHCHNRAARQALQQLQPTLAAAHVAAA